MEAEGRTVKAVIVTEAQPSDPSWATLCEREGIVLGWAPANLSVA
jgi:hypothetical protein